MADQKKREWIGLRDLTDAARLAQKRQEAESARTQMKRDWALNRSYYLGNQWCIYNPLAGKIEQLNIDVGPKWRVRLQSNQIKPGLNHYVAQLTKTRPTINAEPDSGSDKDIKAAQMAESLYEYIWDEKHLNQKVQDALIEAGLSGGFWKITWDALAGKPITFTMDPNGNPITDDELASVYLDEMEQQLAAVGQDPQMADQLLKKTVYLGDIRIDVMPVENVLLDTGAARFEDCNWAICKHALDPDEIEARWGVKVSPDSMPVDQMPTIGQREKPENTLRNVYIMYIRPCPAVPKGRYVAWIEEPNKILQDVEWPYPFMELPLVKFPGIYRPGSVLDDAITTDARPLQDDLNKALSQITEYRNLTIKPQILAPYGSLREKISGEPGAAIEFSPIGNLIPQWRDMPALPGYVFNAIADTQMRIDRLFNRMPSTRDQLPSRADSGHMVEQMQEAVADQLSPVILGLEDALARAGHLIAAYAQTYYEEPRLLKIRGAGGSVQVKKFQRADIAGGFTFRPRYGTGLPRSREGKRQAIMELLEAQLIDPKTAIKHLDLADLKGVTQKIARAEDFAYRTLDKLRHGQPLNIFAMQQAQEDMQQFQEQAAEFEQQAQEIMEQVQAGVELDLNQDGQPDDPQEIVYQLTQYGQQLQQQQAQLEQELQDAPWQPLPYEDKGASIEVLGDFMQTVEFDGYPPELQQLFVRRFELLMQAIQAEQQPDPATLPKVNATAKATVSAPVFAKILQAQGIDVSEDEVAAPPLETAVYDSVDKPDADDAGNDPLTEEEHDLEMQQAEDEHLSKQAKAAADMARAAALQQYAQEKQDQELAQSDEQHQMQMDAAAAEQQRQDELHQERLNQMRNPRPSSSE